MAAAVLVHRRFRRRDALRFRAPPRRGQTGAGAYDAQVAVYRQTVLGAFQEVEDNLAALRLLAEETVEQDAATQGAEQSLSLEMERYKAGIVSYLDVITDAEHRPHQRTRLSADFGPQDECRRHLDPRRGRRLG